MDPRSHQHKEACNCIPGGSTSQTLAELEFERGIWYAAQSGDLQRVKHFLDKGVCPNLEDSAGYTALHYAARNDHYEICQELLKYGANVNAKTRSGRVTALHRAAMQKHSKLVKLLLEAGADQNIQDDDGYTAAHRSAIVNDVETIKILLPITETTLKDKNGCTARDLAKKLEK